jgi:methylenetetrahydrofolate reductase (NADPH)
MKTADFFKSKQTLSFEIFPPKRTDSVDSVYRTLEQLGDLSPDFISVTYGAGGCENSATTIDIASDVKNKYGIESVAHLPCIGLHKPDVLNILEKLSFNGIENVLALRGDRPEGREIPEGDFAFASDLISFIREAAPGDFNIVAACYPEGHAESPDMAADIRNLKLKVDAGADHLISQLFFDNAYFYDFQERARAAGIGVPIEAGIMPAINRRQIERITALCGATIPAKYLDMMERYENDPVAMQDAGIAYAVDQIVDLITRGVDGVHLYTMNEPYVAKRIYKSVASLLK